jgi:hypothetical protein
MQSTSVSLLQRSAVKTLWTNLFCRATVICAVSYRQSVRRHLSQTRTRSLFRKRRSQSQESPNGSASFRQNWKPYVPAAIHLPRSPHPFQKNVREKLILLIRTISILNVNPFLPMHHSNRLAEAVVAFLDPTDRYISRRDLESRSSLLFATLKSEPARGKEISLLLSFLRFAKPSKGRTTVCFRLALNLARYADRCPLLFQAALRPIIDKRVIRDDEIVNYFRKRKFVSKRISYSPRKLVNWLIDCVVSNKSMHYYMPFIARESRGLVPLKLAPSLLRLIHGLMPIYTISDSTSASLNNPGVWPTNTMPYIRFISMSAHYIRRSDREKVNIRLTDNLIRSLIDTNLFLHSIYIFDALQRKHLDSWIDLQTLLPYFRKLIATQNYYDAINAYQAILQRLHRGGSKSQTEFNIFDPDMIPLHVHLWQSETGALISLIRGLRQTKSCHQFILHLLSFVPRKQIRRDYFLAAEILRYAGYWDNRSLVQKTLSALGFPFYDKSHPPSEDKKTYNFHEDLWSAILYAHIYVGLVDASHLIFQSMKKVGLAPRFEDMSNIVCGVAKFNLESGYELAIRLEGSVDANAYETLLELALEQNHTAIAEWAQSFVAPEIKPERELPDLEIEINPSCFHMESELSLVTNHITGFRTARGVGAVIKHIAQTKGMESAILMLLDCSSMTFSRDVYDKLYHIAFDSGDIRCAMYLAMELRARGWMPRKFRELKGKLVSTFGRLKL